MGSLGVHTTQILTILGASLLIFAPFKAGAGGTDLEPTPPNAPVTYTEQQIIERYRSNYLAYVERERLGDLKVCADLLSVQLSQRKKDLGDYEKYRQRRKILEANLPAYAWDVQAIHFMYDIPGLQIAFEQGPYSGSLHTSEIKQFHLIYDPSKFSRFSVIRRMFGNSPLNYSKEDLRVASDSGFASEEGKMAEFYLKGNNRSGDVNFDDGGMIMISRDTGQIRFWPPGTDVDGEMEGILRGSLGAVGRFAMGLVGEAQNEFHKYSGSWFTDREVLDLTPTHALQAPNPPRE